MLFSSQDKTKALEETKAYASQSLASVAYQVHSLAVNMLQMMDQQMIQMQKMSADVNNISLVSSWLVTHIQQKKSNFVFR